MPYRLNSKEAFKYDYYKNIFEADKTEQLRLADKDFKRMNISGSTLDATQPIRDDNGVLISYENPEDSTKSVEEPYQYVRLNINQKVGTTKNVLKFFGNDLQITDIFPKVPESKEVQDIDNIVSPELQTEIDTFKNLNNELQNKINEQLGVPPIEKSSSGGSNFIKSISELRKRMKSSKKIAKYVKELFGAK